MKAMVCKVCGYIPLDGAVPDNCPICGVPKDKFVEKENAYKTPKDAAAGGQAQGYKDAKGAAPAAEPAKKHIPFITVNKKCGLFPEGCVDVQVKIGEVIHPMLPEHFIMWIDFYLDKKYIARIHLTPTTLNPAAGLHLKVDKGTFSAMENCNIHGSWLNEVDL